MANAPTQTSLFDVSDCKIWPLLTDLPTAASPTYGAIVDVPGITAISLDPNIVSAELKGDGRVLRSKARIDKFTSKCTYDLLDLNVLLTVMGGIQSVNTSAEQAWDMVLNGPSASLPYFGAAFEITDTDDELGAADVHFVCYKCKLTGGSPMGAGAQTENFSQPTIEFETIGPLANQGAFRAVRARILNAETALALP